MKNKIVQYKWMLIGIMSMFSFTSCGNFFDESSQDEIKPSNIEDLKAVMYKEAYPYQMIVDPYLNLLTDETQCNGLLNDNYTSQHKSGQPIFCFEKNMFDATHIIADDTNSWKNYYEKIMGCNVVKDYLDKVSGTDKDKNGVLGQVLFLRAYYYLKLALIYCQPYSGKNINPDTALGLPLQLTMTVSDTNLKRTTLRETYAQIEKDLLESLSLLKENYNAESAFRVDEITANCLLSRLYLYMGRNEDMANVVKYADAAIDKGPALTNFDSFQSSYGNKGVYDLDVSSEVVWTYGNASYYCSTYFVTNAYTEQFPYTVSNSLVSLYDATNDLRYRSYLRPNMWSSDMQYTHKKGTANSTYGDNGIRMAEIYLNRAEALIREAKIDGDASKITKALSDLNTLRRSRYVSQTYTDINIIDADKLLDFCLQERQRELCWEEGFRWFDIKRLGLSVTHTYLDADENPTTFTLESNSLLYALPIPYDAIDRNKNLEQNPR